MAEFMKGGANGTGNDAPEHKRKYKQHGIIIGIVIDIPDPHHGSASRNVTA